MKKNIINVILIIVFLSTIFLPQIIFSFIENNESDISITENRKLAPKPKFELKNIEEYPEKFDNYFNDHLPFRNMLRKIWSNLNYELFHITVDNRVIIGQDNWLFYREDKSIEQAQGLFMYETNKKEQILDNLQQNVNELKEKGIETYVMVVPTKENLYREKLPNTIPIKENISKTEDLVNYIKENSDINIIYPKEELLLAKEKHQIYRAYDTHWNEIGALIGTISLQKKINPNFSYNLEEMKVEETDEVDLNDLATFAGLNDKLFENKVTVKNFYPNITYSFNETFEYEEYTSNINNDKVVLFIGDSFRENMKMYFSKLYKKVIYLHRDNYSKTMIDEFEPDIVIFETIERFPNALGIKYNF